MKLFQVIAQARGLPRQPDLRMLVLGGVLMAVVGCLGGGASVNLTSQRTAADETQKAAIGEIYQLQAAFHRAKTTQDIDLMMSLWAPGSVLHTGGKDYRQSDGSLRSFWLSSGSFVHHRFSLVPSFKEVIEPNGDTAYLYFECHDVANFASTTNGDGDADADSTGRYIVSDTFLKGTVKFVNGSWLFWDMTAGAASPLSIDTSY